MSKLIKVVFATVAGFAAGILMAPKSGKETRADLKKKAEEAKQTAELKAEQAQVVAIVSGSAILIPTNLQLGA